MVIAFKSNSFFTLLLDDVLLPRGLQVYIKDHDCVDNIERLYYSWDYEPCCIYCGDYVENVDGENYPQIPNCTKNLIKKKSTIKCYLN